MDALFQTTTDVQWSSLCLTPQSNTRAKQNKLRSVVIPQVSPNEAVNTTVETCHYPCKYQM